MQVEQVEATDKDSDDGEDYESTNWDYAKEQFWKSPYVLSACVLSVCYGLFLISSLNIRSTYFCASLDNSSLVHRLQWLGLLLDGAIVVLAWRVLAWCRTAKSRLETLSGLLLSSSAAYGLLHPASFLRAVSVKDAYESLDRLYFFDVFSDGFALSAFLLSSLFTVCEDSPLSLAAATAFSSGLVSVVQKTRVVGTWENVQRLRTWNALLFLSAGFYLLVYMNSLRRIVCVARPVVVALLASIFCTGTAFLAFQSHDAFQAHPLKATVYETRIEADRWLIRASTSQNVRTAVREYQDRNHGRDPPANFDIWFRFALQKKSRVVDRFVQMERDLLPFWGMPPKQIRESVESLAYEPEIAIVSVMGGAVFFEIKKDDDPGHRVVLQDLVGMMQSFSHHLPDMKFAVNLHDNPRVLAPWDDIYRYSMAGKRKSESMKTLSTKSVSRDGTIANRKLGRNHGDDEGMGGLGHCSMSEDLASDGGATKPGRRPSVRSTKHSGGRRHNITSVREFREMTVLTCPPKSRARSGVHWNIRDFCFSCVQDHSSSLFLTNWDYSLDVCHQPDLLRLHGFYMTPPELRPMQDMVPVFSRSRTDSYSDILVPLRRRDESGQDGEGSVFETTQQKLFWRGNMDGLTLTHDRLRGGHLERLVHLVDEAPDRARTTMLVPTGAIKGNKTMYAFEEASARELNTALAMDVGFDEFTGCRPAPAPGSEGASILDSRTASTDQAGCRAAQAEFRLRARDPLTAATSRFQLVADADAGPPGGGAMLGALRSGGVPLVASVFREWYTERLMAWAHFVPVDVRLHGLHSTLAYFMGGGEGGEGWVRGREPGRDPGMEPHTSDARWIAHNGKRWAKTAIRREDAEVYLFRLLLEWGRLVDDQRDEKGFRWRERVSM